MTFNNEKEFEIKGNKRNPIEKLLLLQLISDKKFVQEKIDECPIDLYSWQEGKSLIDKEELKQSLGLNTQEEKA